MALFSKKKKEEDKVVQEYKSDRLFGVYVIVEDSKELIHKWLNSVGIYPILVTEDFALGRKRFNSDPDDSILIIIDGGRGRFSVAAKRDEISDILKVNNEYYDENEINSSDRNVVSDIDETDYETDMYDMEEDFESMDDTEDNESLYGISTSSKKIVKLIYTDDNLRADMKRKYNEYIKAKVYSDISFTNLIQKNEMRKKLIKNEAEYIKYYGLKSLYDVLMNNGYRLYKGKACSYVIDAEEVLRYRVTGLPPEVAKVVKSNIHYISDDVKCKMKELLNSEESDNIKAYDVKVN